MSKLKRAAITAISILFWLVIWQIIAMKINSKILLVSPIEVAGRLIRLVPMSDFWNSVLFSAGRILLGFALGMTAGCILALAAGKLKIIRVLFAPLISAMKSIPVASFTILALIWIGSKDLSVLVSFLICVPIVYANMLEGIDNLDPKLKEMSKIFSIPPWKRFTGVYLSQLLPYFRSAVRLAVGLCWKSGVAAEVIGIPDGSMGEKLFESKVYLETADLFAWTLAVILLSWLCEKVFVSLVALLQRRVCADVPGGFRTKARDPVPGKNGSAPAGIKAENICRSFGDNKVLSGFSHEFAAGKATAVLGKSGCGKSTLLNILMGLMPPDSGEVIRPEDCRISAVFQEDRLCENLTASANIRLVTGKRFSKEQIAAELDKVGLGGCGNKPARTLSGGMKRRVALLRALLAEYDALFLDEPFKGLDTETKQNVMEYCKEKTVGKTVILVTHDADECGFLADEVVRLESNV